MPGSTISGRWRVFVYGTLKNGQPNHHWLSTPDNGYQTFLGQAASVNKFPLVVASRYELILYCTYCIESSTTHKKVACLIASKLVEIKCR